MPDDAFAALVARVGAFHVTDRAMKKAQLTAEEALRNGTADQRVRDAYVDAVRRYFTPFEREARTHLRDVDRRLEHANQVVFNLTAERGVAVKRIEATQGVLTDLAAIEQKV
jgi:enoyl-CoA hydratase/carnithine racemase